MKRLLLAVGLTLALCVGAQAQIISLVPSAGGGGGGSGVTSFGPSGNVRTGAVVPAANDYTISQINGACGTLTSGVGCFSMTGTYNNGSAVFPGLFQIAVAVSAEAAGSKLFDFASTGVVTDFFSSASDSTSRASIQFSSANTTASALKILNTSVGGHIFSFESTGSSNGRGVGVLSVLDATSSSTDIFDVTTTSFVIPSTSSYGFGTIGLSDTNTSRVTAGVVGVGTGAVGSVAGRIEAAAFLPAKQASACSAPGAGVGDLRMVAGTTAGTAKLIACAGTSTTPATILDNIGSGF